ncbi:MAG: sensor domain-containing diguanylate cyclase [Acidobacteria bacterium]|nr:MAG: sensor domain-containing diguanylate cyclase [Acidobacteriota bacterium]
MTTFFEKRTSILFLHWSVVLLTASILYFGDPRPGFTLNNWMILLLLGGHAALSVLRPIRFEDRSLIYLLVLADVGGACLAAWLSGAPGSVFYLLLFVSIIIAALARSRQLLITFSVVLALAYPGIVSLGGWPLEDVHWLTALLVGDCTLFFGYLAQLQRAHEEQKEASSTYKDLSEFAKALSREDDTEELHSRIPRLIAQIMGVDNCELALIEDDKITKRILPNRHCRDFQNIEIAQSIHERAVATSGGIYASDEMQADLALSSKRDFSLYPYRAYIGKAWMVHKKPAGVLALYMEKKGPWSEYSKQQFQFLVDHSALALQNLRLKLELENQARTDGLTELANHRYFYERLEEEFERASRKKHLLSVALIDLDHFKKLNDSAGHRVGDQVLKALSEHFRKSIRRIDLAGRLGGDEFAIALQETTNDDALMLCRRILEGAARLRVGQLTGFSLSIGCATFPADGETLSELIEHADQALYYSKNLGRGRVSKYADVVGQQKTR